MLKVGSLYTGVGGFDKGFENVGMVIRWQVENDKFCNQLLKEKWPKVKRYGDIRTVLGDRFFKVLFEHELPEKVDVLCGGDPCPSRSLARGGRDSIHPDLSGYFLAVAGRLLPRWVVRENVPARDVADFICGLDCLGYRTLAIELDAKDFTGQSRRREILIASSGNNAANFERLLLLASDGIDDHRAKNQTQTCTSCITAALNRMAEDTYIFEAGRDGGYRVLTCEEREALQGFPRGWTAGFSRSRRAIMLGNAIPVPFAEFIGGLIVEVEEGGDTEAG